MQYIHVPYNLPLSIRPTPREVCEARVRVAYKRFLRRKGITGLENVSTASLKSLVRLVATGRG